jgi:hypothetical protein
MNHYNVRSHTKALSEIIACMLGGSVPCVDTESPREYEFVVGMLSSRGFRTGPNPLDRKALDRSGHPGFDFRETFLDQHGHSYPIDFFHPPATQKRPVNNTRRLKPISKRTS